MFLKLILLCVQLLVFDKKCKDFMKNESMNYSNTPWKLAKHRSVSPQNVYKSFTNGLQHKLTFIAMKTPNSDSLLGKIEKRIDNNLTPNHETADWEFHQEKESEKIREKLKGEKLSEP